jgi:hypothetical protein
MKEMREVRPATATAPRHNLVAKVVLSVVVSKSIVRGMKGLGQPEKGESTYVTNIMRQKKNSSLRGVLTIFTMSQTPV